MKESPVLDQEVDLTKKRDILPFLKDIKKQTERDENDRGEWDAKQEEWYARRYAQVDKSLDYPWPGASNIWIPISDQLIDKVKPSLLQLYTSTTPIVHFRSRTPVSAERGRKLENFYDWGWRTAMKNPTEEFAYAMDNMLERGFGALMTTYAYQTEKTTLVVKKKFLPPPINQFLTVRTRAAADEIRRISGGRVNPVTYEEFDRNIQVIEQTVAKLYGLHDDDPVDRKAIRQIVAFLRSNAQEVRVEVQSEIENAPQVVSLDQVGS